MIRATLKSECAQWAGIVLILMGVFKTLSGCAGEHDEYIPREAYTEGLAACLSDVHLAKEAMRKTDAGIDRDALRRRYLACATNIESVFGPDAGE